MTRQVPCWYPRHSQTKFSLVFTYHALNHRALPGSRSASMASIELR